jgi:hypothetical protein
MHLNIFVNNMFVSYVNKNLNCAHICKLQITRVAFFFSFLHSRTNYRFLVLSVLLHMLNLSRVNLEMFLILFVG